MAAYYYNDALLLELPAGLVDDTYKYVVIRKYVSGDSTLYYATSSPSPFYYSETSNISGAGSLTLDDTSTTIRECFGNDAMWLDVEEKVLSDSSLYIGTVGSSVYSLLWTNHDILNKSDNEVYMAGSEPVLFVPKICRFGDLLFPEFPDGLPTDGYDHILIVKVTPYNDDPIQYFASLSSTQYYTSTTDGSTTIKGVDSTADAKFYSFNSMTDTWGFVFNSPIDEAGFPVGDVTDIGLYEIVYSNYDVRSGSADSTDILLSASEMSQYDLKKYQYNESILSELPIGYPNSEYPYACILDQMILILTSTKLYTVDNTDGLKVLTPADGTAPTILCLLGSTTGLWNQYVTGAASDMLSGVALGDGGSIMNWSNFDVVDGSADSTTVYFAASEPVEYVETLVPENTGELYYYNDILLPEIPPNILAEYPYVYLSSANIGGEVTYGIRYAKTPILADDSNLYTTGTEQIEIYSCYLENDVWEMDSNDEPQAGDYHTFTMKYGDLSDTFGFTFIVDILWSNHDIHYVDSTTGEISSEIYLAASEPVLYEPVEYWYRGTKLLELRPDVLETYPYCFIKRDTGPETFTAYFATSRWYASQTESGYTIQPEDTSVTFKSSVYDNSTDSWGAIADNEGTTTIEVVSRSSKTVAKVVDIRWSNTDIPIGSMDATELYINATPPIKYVERGNSYYNGTLLPDYPIELIEEKPYVLIYVTNTKYLDSDGIINNFFVIMSDKKLYVDSSTPTAIYVPDGFHYQIAIMPEFDLVVYDGEYWCDGTSYSLPLGTSEVSNSYTSYIENDYVLWSNYDVPIGSTDGGEIYLEASAPIPENQRMAIKYVSLMDFADQARRLAYSNDRLSLDEMLSIFKTALPSDAIDLIKKAEEDYF